MTGAYRIELTAHSYRNPTGRCAECQQPDNATPAGCCDESFSRPTGEACPVACDTTIVECYAPLRTRSTGQQDCRPTPVIAPLFNPNNNTFDFSGSFFGFTNPRVRISSEAWVVSKLCKLYIQIILNLVFVCAGRTDSLCCC